jgi:hypothetical protein
MKRYLTVIFLLSVPAYAGNAEVQSASKSLLIASYPLIIFIVVILFLKVFIRKKRITMRQRHAQSIEMTTDTVTQVVDSPLFGKLKHSQSSRSYTGQVTWCGVEVNLRLSCEGSGGTSKVLDVAGKLFSFQGEWGQRVNDFAVQQLLPLKNDVWLEEDEDELTAAQFLSRMRLTSIDVDESGSFTFWHNDGGLFWGHLIQIDGDLANGLTHADIPG